MYLGQLKKLYSVYIDITLDKAETAHIVAIEFVSTSYNLNSGKNTSRGPKLRVNKSKKNKSVVV